MPRAAVPAPSPPPPSPRTSARARAAARPSPYAAYLQALQPRRPLRRLLCYACGPGRRPRELPQPRGCAEPGSRDGEGWCCGAVGQALAYGPAQEHGAPARAQPASPTALAAAGRRPDSPPPLLPGERGWPAPWQPCPAPWSPMTARAAWMAPPAGHGVGAHGSCAAWRGGLIHQHKNILMLVGSGGGEEGKGGLCGALRVTPARHKHAGHQSQGAQSRATADFLAASPGCRGPNRTHRPARRRRLCPGSPGAPGAGSPNRI